MLTLPWIFALVSATNAIPPLLDTLYEWRSMDMLWTSVAQREWYRQNGFYDHQSIIPIDVDQSPDGRIFVTTIKMPGVPATLYTVTSKYNASSGPLLKPYPDWSWYNKHMEPCLGLINVYRVAIDECNRIWVLDTGLVNGVHMCPAKLVAFNLKDDKPVYWEELSDRVAQNATGFGQLVTPIVELDGSDCSSFTVYMADVLGHGLVITKNKRAIRIGGPAFVPVIQYSDFSIAGQRFYMEDGVTGMALTPRMRPGQERYLFFRPMSSRSMYYASTNTLKNSFNGGRVNFVGGTDILSSQAVAMAFSSEGTLFYVLTSEHSIGCWNMRNPLQPQFFRIAYTDVNRLQFVSGLKIKKMPGQSGQEYILMMSNSYQRMATSTRDWNEVNYRVMTIPVRSLIGGTICDANGRR